LKRIETYISSDTDYYLSAFFNSSEHFIEPVSRGHKLLAVYDILWVNAKTVIPKNFPVFLASLQQLKEACAPWLQNP
jgi:hypothetical protein